MKPLEALEDIVNEYYIDNKDKELDIIETALTEYEGAKTHIEALNKERIENSIKLKALEIIAKNISFNGRKIVQKNLWNLSQEEFDLLKEVLK